MQEQLVPHDLLEKSDKILFVTHLALGDFTYWQNYFRAFHKKYPHLKIDLWVDEGRGKSSLRRWNSKKSNYVLYDWLASCGFINKVYKNTNSWWQLNAFFKDCYKNKYPIVVSLSMLRSHKLARFSRKISPNGFVVGLFKECRRYQFFKKNCLKKFNKAIIFGDISKKHLHFSDFCALCFEQFFGITVSLHERLPFILFPHKWSYFGKLKLLKWGIHKKDRFGQKNVFINAFAKNKSRCWPIEKVFELISELQKDDFFYDARFIVNVLPGQYKHYQESLKNFSLNQIFLFTADFNFFQLPSVISVCDLVISVETSVIHFAAALKIPVIALMRKKNPEWVPLGTTYSIVGVKEGKDRIKNIVVDDVVNTTKTFIKS